MLRHALVDAVNLPSREARPGVLGQAERAVTVAHAEAVAAFTAQHHIAREEIDIVGFHGQTVLHRPEQRMTVQIGDGLALAKAIHIPVMHDFRAADVAAGGQGAPLVPVYHRALASELGRGGPIVVVNIGGVSNITYIDGFDALIACDTGPGNALIDDYMLRTTGQPFDNDGRLASEGHVDESWVTRALQHPFFGLRPPKSLDRNQFASLVLPNMMSAADGAATLTALTVEAIASIVPQLPKTPQSWIIAGGGARNLTMRRMLRRRPRTGAGRRRRYARMGGRCHRGTGVCVSRSPQPAGTAAELSRDHRRPRTDDRRRHRPSLGPLFFSTRFHLVAP